MSKQTPVANKYNQAFDVYIGRGSIWGNPLKLEKGHPPAQRELAVDQIASLRDKRLGCFCAPRRWHDDVLAKYADLS